MGIGCGDHHVPFHSYSPSSPASQSHAAFHVHDVQKAARKSRTKITPRPCRSHTFVVCLKRERGADPEGCERDREWERETDEGLGQC